MKSGFVMPFGHARQAAALAQAAEEAGWDGFFVWEPVWGFDAWVSLAAAAMVTKHIRLGTMISPISRMRPWKLASETVNLDHLSNGRVILSVGLGAPETGFDAFGEVVDRKTRADLLDEGLDILTGLWKGGPFSYQGHHYTISPTNFMPPPPPVQQPRIPIWVVGAWPLKKSMDRVLKYDGILPMQMGPGSKTIRQVTPETVSDLKQYFEEHVPHKQMDIIIEGETTGINPEEDRAIIQPWQAAGATWWIETRWKITDQSNPTAEIQKRIQAGPPTTRDQISDPLLPSEL